VPLLAFAVATSALIPEADDHGESVLQELLAGGDRASRILALLFGYAIAIWLVESVLQFVAQAAFLVRASDLLETQAPRPLTTTLWITIRRLPSVVLTGILVLVGMILTSVVAFVVIWLFSHAPPLWVGTAALGLLLRWRAPSFHSPAVGWALTVLIPFGLPIRVGILLSLAIPLAALGELAHMEALQESARRVAGRWWTVALASGVIAVLAQVVSAVVEHAFDAVFDIAGLSAATWATGVAGWTVSAPLVAIGWMLLLRERRLVRV
jgi:hypothetical protein